MEGLFVTDLNADYMNAVAVMSLNCNITDPAQRPTNGSTALVEVQMIHAAETNVRRLLIVLFVMIVGAGACFLYLNTARHMGGHTIAEHERALLTQITHAAQLYTEMDPFHRTPNIDDLIDDGGLLNRDSFTGLTIQPSDIRIDANGVSVQRVKGSK